MASVTAARRARLSLAAGLCLLFALAGFAPARADAPSAGGDVSIAQTLGDRELTVVLRRVTSVPGPLRVEVVTHAGTPAGRLTLTAIPVGASSAPKTPAAGAPTSRGGLDLGAAPGMYSATLNVDRAGPWELAVGDGARVARIPFVVPTQPTSPPERLVYGGFLAAGLLLPVSVVVALRARRTAWALLPVGGVVAGIAVAVTGAVLSASLPLPPQPGIQLDPSVDNVTHPYALGQPLVSDFSRPPVMLTVGGAPLTAGQPGDLGLDLADAATGAPVDDLVIHDSALIHLLVIGPTGTLQHLHPIRTAPGRYQVHLVPPAPGHYALSAELARRGGGVQMVRAATGFTVAPGAAPTPTPDTPLRPGGMAASATLGGTPVTVTATAARAGAPTTLTATFGDAADLQPWLGMVGHMVVAGPLPDTPDIGAAVQNSPVWGHAHSMGGSAMGDMGDMPGMSMPGMADMPGMHHDSGGAMLMLPVNGDSAPDETVAAYGPNVPFTYTFPAPGRYRIWIQAERHYTVLTIPIVLDVAAPEMPQ